MSAPRIDTFRNVVDAVMTRLEEIRPEIEDIHDLAYNRTRAMGDKVKGGSVDYALDTHGDMRARELYIDAAARLVGLGRATEQSLKAIRRYLNQDDGRIRRYNGSVITAAEFDGAVTARSRRSARGEHHPHRVVAQPERAHRIDPNVELEQLRGAVRRLAKHLDREHRGCVNEDGARRGRWLDRSIMNPAQRDALDRALLTEADRAAAS